MAVLGKPCTVSYDLLLILLLFYFTASTARNVQSVKHKEKLSVKSDVEVVNTLLDIDEFKHHDYDEMLWFMKYFATKYSDIAALYDIGESVQNRKLWVLEISSKPGEHQPGKPEVKLVSGIHGEEAIGKEILLQFIKMLCEKYDKDPQLTELVDNTRIHIMPSLNPDGYAMARSHNNNANGIGHTNAHGVDLNRNFPDQFFPKASPTQLETEAVQHWITSHPFVLSASLHAGALVVTYPYDDSPSGQSVYSATPDDDVFRHLAKTYSVHHPVMHLANPKLNCTDSGEHFIDGITNGAKWFSVAGGMQDYNYVRSNCFEVTIQVGCDKFPNASQIKTYWEQNKESLLKFVSQVHSGVKGFVRDVDGKVLDGARITVSDRQHPISAAQDGDYWRLLVPGSYEIEAYCSGFKAERKFVEVNSDGVQELDFALKPVGEQGEFEYNEFMETDPRERKKNWPARSENKLKDVDSTTVVPHDTRADFSEAPVHTNNDRPMHMKSFAVRRPASPEEEEDSSSERKDHLATTAESERQDHPATTAEPPAHVATGDKPVRKHKKQMKRRGSVKNQHRLQIGAKVTCRVRGKSEKLSGVLKWHGFLPSLPRTTENMVAGIELAQQDKLGTDGTFMGRKYFQAPPKRGYFVKYKDCRIVK